MKVISSESPFGTCGYDRFGSEFEPHLVVDPRNPRKLVAAWIQDRFAGQVVSYTRDGGRTWTRSIPVVSSCSGGDASYTNAGDPWLSIGPDGTVYLASVVFSNTQGHLTVNTSRDGGQTWGKPVVIGGEANQFADKQVVVAHPTRAGTAYLVWADFTGSTGQSGSYFSKTSDGGKTWSRPVLMHISPDAWENGNELQILPDGRLVNVFVRMPLLAAPYWYGGVKVEGTTYEIAASVSDDDGATWSVPTTVDRFWSALVTDPDDGSVINSGDFLPHSAVAPNGDVYVAWQQIDDDETGWIRLTRSIDGGETWTAPRAISPGLGQALTPAVAVAADGTVAVSYFDFRHDVEGDVPLTTEVWLTHSHDRGRSWTEHQLAGAFDLRKIPAKFLGDYTGLVALPQGFGAALPMPALGGGFTSDIVFVRTNRA